MSGFCRAALAALLCFVLAACGGGGGSEGGSGGGGGSGSGSGGGGGGNPPTIPAPNQYLPTDTSIQLTYSGSGTPAQFEATTARGSHFVAPFRYATGGKEY